MKTYSNNADAIYDLHKQGFTNDFHLAGNDLLWIQENLVIRMGIFLMYRGFFWVGCISMWPFPKILSSIKNRLRQLSPKHPGHFFMDFYKAGNKIACSQII